MVAMHESVACARESTRARPRECIPNRPVLWNSLFLIKFDLIAMAKQNAIIDLTNVCSAAAVFAGVPFSICPILVQRIILCMQE